MHYRAGRRALERLRDGGVNAATVRAAFGPASGPRWIVFAGLDRALLGSGLLGEGTLLAGASAGAWRMLAFATPDPVATHQELLDGYIEQAFDRKDNAVTVSRAYRDMLERLFAQHVETIPAHPAYDVVIHTARLRGPRSRAWLAAALATIMAAHRIGGRGTRAMFERVAFASRPSRNLPGFTGAHVALSRDNLIDAALASGTMPFYLQSVRDPAGAPRGDYVDGGLTDYHLNQRYLDEDAGVLLLMHYQRGIVPRWMERRRALPPTADLAADVLLVHPSDAFVAGLPDGRLPDRDDFFRFMDAPHERIRRWREVASASQALGEAFERDLADGSIPDRLEAL